MKKYINIFGSLGLALMICFSSCTSNVEPVAKIEVSSIAIENPAKALNALIELNGDYINASNSPYLFDNSDVLYNGEEYLLLDLRSQEDYEKGHVNGAIRVERKDLMSYMQNNHPENYKKVILIDNNGFESAYAASILRATGYNHIYPLKFGMGAWNNKFAHFWKNGISNKYAARMETKKHKKGKKRKLPELKVTSTTATGVLEERANAVLTDDFLITADELMADPSAFYVVNYWPTKMYNNAHVPGAICYNPKTSLKLESDLQTISTKKKIVVYCYSGTTSSVVVGYLRLIGYDAYSLSYGAHGMMHNKLQSNDWHTFDLSAKLKNYPITTGPEAKSYKTVTSSGKGASAPAPIIKRQKKDVGGGGCD